MAGNPVDHGAHLRVVRTAEYYHDLYSALAIAACLYLAIRSLEAEEATRCLPDPGCLPGCLCGCSLYASRIEKGVMNDFFRDPTPPKFHSKR